MDVSPVERPQAANCRYVIASSKAAPLFDLNPAVSKWSLHTLGCDSFFQVLDLQVTGDQSRILLLHVPAQGVRYFGGWHHAPSLTPEADLEPIRQLALDRWEQQKDLPPNPVFDESEWLARTSLPIGPGFGDGQFGR